MATTIFGSNPYGSFKEVTPEWTECEICERKLKTRDWTAHKNSKKHRENEKNASVPGSATYLPGLRGGAKDGIMNAVSFEVTSAGSGADSNGFTPDNFGNCSSNMALGSCYKCGESGHMARDCTQACSKSGCFNCGDEGHISRDCPNPKRGGKECYNCNQTGHMSKDCPLKQGGGGGRACYNCGGTDHLSRDCSQPKQGGGGGGRACYNCQETGHMLRDCPHPKNPNARPPRKDFSTMKCHNCGEMGHPSYRCTNEPANNGGDSGGWDNAGNSGGATSGWDNSADDNAGGDSSWDNSNNNNDGSWN